MTLIPRFSATLVIVFVLISVVGCGDELSDDAAAPPVREVQTSDEPTRTNGPTAKDEPAPVPNDPNPTPDEVDVTRPPAADSGEERTPSPMVDGAPAPADLEGECTNPADEAALTAHEATLNDTITGCAFECLGQDSSCSSACLARDVGLSEPCSVCFGDMVACTMTNCALPCLDAGSGGCRQCQAASCDENFTLCAGIDPQR